MYNVQKKKGLAMQAQRPNTARSHTTDPKQSIRRVIFKGFVFCTGGLWAFIELTKSFG
jgi:hypothetical protein